MKKKKKTNCFKIQMHWRRKKMKKPQRGDKQKYERASVKEGMR